MLKVQIEDKTIRTNDGQEIFVKGGLFHFEHSLKAISIWESKWRKPFLTDGEKTIEESIDYVFDMCLDDGLTIYHMNDDLLTQVYDYIKEHHTATTIKNDGEPNRRVITSEVLYSYLAVSQIPFDVENWNLDRLMMVVGSVSALNSPPKKMSQAEVMAENKRLNAERKKQLKTTG